MIMVSNHDPMSGISQDFVTSLVISYDIDFIIIVATLIKA